MPQAYKGLFLGSFTEYKMPPDDPRYVEGGYFCKNEPGADLYDIRNLFGGGLFVMTGPNDNVIVGSAAYPFIPLPANGQQIWHIDGLGSADERAVLGGTVTA